MVMSQVLRLGFAGLGMAAGRLIPEIARLPFIKLTAAAICAPMRARSFTGNSPPRFTILVEEMCQSADVDAVYVATPHEFHASHAIAALENRKHVIVEKPMAVSLDEAEAMNRCADEHGVKLMAGHTHSFDPPVRKIREIVRSEELGRLLMISSIYYKDHMYRPFSDHDIKMSRGVVLNQGPHQVDIARLIGGGKVRSVRAMAGVGDPLRPGEGHYTGYLEFEDGAAASLVYSGYAYFDSAELVWGLGEGGEIKDPERHLKARQFFRRLRTPSQQKALENKLEQWRYGGSSEGQWTGESSSREKRQPFSDSP
jgi:phthalate 4,5-cis-dihydrodiol dehydrogenase